MQGAHQLLLADIQDAAGRQETLYSRTPGWVDSLEHPEMVKFMMRPEVDAAMLHMCAYAMTSTDEIG